jgi:hypothetical protein
MKTVVLLVILSVCLTILACGGPVKELDDYINAHEEIILQMDKKIEANPTKAGVEEARKVYESKKDDLKAKCAAVSAKKLSGDQTQKMLDSAVTRGKMLDMVKARIKDVDASMEFTKLTNDFNGTCK